MTIGGGTDLFQQGIKGGFRVFLGRGWRFGGNLGFSSRFFLRGRRFRRSTLQGFPGTGRARREGEALQGFQQFRIGRLRFFRVLQAGKHLAQGIHHLQDGIHQFRGDFTLPLPQQVESVFRLVTDLDHGFDIEKTGTTLDGMETTENGIEQVAVRWAVFQLHQLLSKRFQDFPGLDQKILKNVVFEINAHGRSLFSSGRAVVLPAL